MNVELSQPGILAGTSPIGRSLTFRSVPEVDPRPALRRLQRELGPEQAVAGLGEPLVRALGGEVSGLASFPALSGVGCVAPSTQQALWLMLRGSDAGALFDTTVRMRGALADAFALEDAVDTFTYAGGRDLTGFEDGTENPVGDRAHAAALMAGGEHIAGSSFVAVQRWVHDLARFRSFSPERRDHTVGRRLEGNDEIADAPVTAHVKRSAQESYDPPAFIVRRSMPWANASEQGLEFIAYGASLDRFERILRRMMGLDDGIVDALFTFSRPITGGYYWCPPVAGGKLDFAAIGL